MRSPCQLGATRGFLLPLRRRVSQNGASLAPPSPDPEREPAGWRADFPGLSRPSESPPVPWAVAAWVCRPIAGSPRPLAPQWASSLSLFLSAAALPGPHSVPCGGKGTQKDSPRPTVLPEPWKESTLIRSAQGCPCRVVPVPSPAERPAFRSAWRSPSVYLARLACPPEGGWT